MAFFGWLFFNHLFLPLIGPELASQYIAGVIILAAARCTAMVFVWSHLSDGDPAYTLVQVAVNDLIMLVAFAPDREVSGLGSGGSRGAVPGAPVLGADLRAGSAASRNAEPHPVDEEEGDGGAGTGRETVRAGDDRRALPDVPQHAAVVRERHCIMKRRVLYRRGV